MVDASAADSKRRSEVFRFKQITSENRVKETDKSNFTFVKGCINKMNYRSSNGYFHVNNSLRRGGRA